MNKMTILLVLCLGCAGLWGCEGDDKLPTEHRTNITIERSINGNQTIDNNGTASE